MDWDIAGDNSSSLLRVLLHHHVHAADLTVSLRRFHWVGAARVPLLQSSSVLQLERGCGIVVHACAFRLGQGSTIYNLSRLLRLRDFSGFAVYDAAEQGILAVF